MGGSLSSASTSSDPERLLACIEQLNVGGFKVSAWIQMSKVCLRSDRALLADRNP